jgi:tetratricopeptide (TPR) repeat protein
MQLGDYLGARDDYTHALETEPDPALYLHRGWAYFFADAWKAALGDFDETVRINPDDADGFIGRGLTQVMLAEYRQGVSAAAEALHRKIEGPEMMHNVACIFALAAGCADKDPQADRALPAAYRRRALEALGKAVAMLPQEVRRAFFRDKIEPDKALDSIRQSPQFRQLVRDFCARQAP